VIYTSGAGREPFFLIVLPYPPLRFLDPTESSVWGKMLGKQKKTWIFTTEKRRAVSKRFKLFSFPDVTCVSWIDFGTLKILFLNIYFLNAYIYFLNDVSTLQIS